MRRVYPSGKQYILQRILKLERREREGRSAGSEVPAVIPLGLLSPVAQITNHSIYTLFPSVIRICISNNMIRNQLVGPEHSPTMSSGSGEEQITDGILSRSG